MTFKRGDNRFERFLRLLVRDEGQTLAEYGLILAFVSVTALSVGPIGSWLSARFSELAAAI